MSLSFKYIFHLKETDEFHYQVDIDEKTFTGIDTTPIPAEYDKWTDLEFNQCDNCTLTKEDCPKCPMAVSIVHVLDQFKHLNSFDSCDVTVIGSERTYKKHAPLQESIRSLLGLIMGSCGCSHMNFLHTMAVYHLPFSSPNETLIRILGFYLSNEYLENPDQKIDLANLKKKYETLSIVNRGMINRINHFDQGDANRNAVVNLETFVNMFSMNFAMDMGMLKQALHIKT